MTDELDKILDKVSLNSSKGYTKVGLKAAILKLLLKARRDELNKLDTTSSNIMAIPKYIVEDRIAEIDNQIKEES